MTLVVNQPLPHCGWGPISNGPKPNYEGAIMGSFFKTWGGGRIGGVVLRWPAFPVQKLVEKYGSKPTPTYMSKRSKNPHQYRFQQRKMTTKNLHSLVTTEKFNKLTHHCFVRFLLHCLAWDVARHATWRADNREETQVPSFPLQLEWAMVQVRILERPPLSKRKSPNHIPDVWKTLTAIFRPS